MGRRLLGQVQRRLAEGITPAFSGSNVRVAEPQSSIEGHAVADPFDPQSCRDDGSVTPDSHGLSSHASAPIVRALAGNWIAGGLGYGVVIFLVMNY